MWMMELAANTRMAERRIGSHSDRIGTIGTSTGMGSLVSDDAMVIRTRARGEGGKGWLEETPRALFRRYKPGASVEWRTSADGF
jgi:hypothetical protein